MWIELQQQDEELGTFLLKGDAIKHGKQEETISATIFLETQMEFRQ